MKPENVAESKHAARRVKRGDRIIILPPDSAGEMWAGSAR